MFKICMCGFVILSYIELVMFLFNTTLLIFQHFKMFYSKIFSGFRWAESADLANNRALSLSLPRDHRRKEPLGQANTNPFSRLPEPQKY